MVDHAVDDVAGTLAGDDHTRLDLTEFDPVGDFDNAIQHTKTRVADIEDSCVGAYAQGRSNAASRSGFEILSTDATVDEYVDELKETTKYWLDSYQRLAALARETGKKGKRLGDWLTWNCGRDAAMRGAVDEILAGDELG